MKNERKRLKQMLPSDIIDFIRAKLAFDKSIEKSLRYTDDIDFAREHKRFDMTGFDTEVYNCAAHNVSIVNTFAYLGIYDSMDYLNVKFRKGDVMLYYRCNGGEHKEENLSGRGTCEIIFRIFEVTNII